MPESCSYRCRSSCYYLFSRSMTAHRVRIWWTRGGGKDLVIPALGFGSLTIALILTIGTLLSIPIFRSSYSDDISPALVDLTVLRNARQKGALCLDGSSPGYHLQRGFGSGSSNWVIHLEGGGWCDTVKSCTDRRMTKLGSLKHMGQQTAFDGILSSVPSKNPDFFNWNKVKIRYCDGASFFAHVEKTDQNKTTLFFRGQTIWEAIMQELLLKGLASAKQALLTGCSAGGLATFLHCDRFHELLPRAAKVKCFADGGYFLDSKDISGRMKMKSFYNDVVHLHNLEKNLPKGCLAIKEASQCLFPQELMKYISTPFFVLNSAYDWWQVVVYLLICSEACELILKYQTYLLIVKHIQINRVLVTKESDPSDLWLKCKMNINDCNHEQIEVLNDFRETFINALSGFQLMRGAGMYINSCYAHCQTTSSITWHSQQKTANKTIAEAFGDWYFDRSEVKIIDCPYPCNPTCSHNELSLDMLSV